MTITLPEAPTSTLTVRPWPDSVIDAVGHDPRSHYVEQFWLGVLGPSTTWLMRRLAAELETQPSGFELPLADTARALGLGDKGGKHSPFVRALGRCCQFELARPDGDAAMAVRRKIPPPSGPPRGQRRERIIPSVLLKSGAWGADGTPGAGFFLRLSLVRTQDEASHLEVQMILKTGNSVYEVDEDEKRFRLVGRNAPGAGDITIGRWQHCDFMTPAE